MSFERAGCAAPPPALLHNMFCGPNAMLRRNPTPRARLVELAVPVVLDGRRRRGGSARAWLELLGRAPPRGSSAEHERKLAAVLERAAAQAGLPPIVPLIDRPGDPLAGLSDRLDVVLAVVAKSSGGAYVAGAEPVLARLARRHRLTLVLPLGWRLPS